MRKVSLTLGFSLVLLLTASAGFCQTSTCGILQPLPYLTPCICNGNIEGTMQLHECPNQYHVTTACSSAGGCGYTCCGNPVPDLCQEGSCLVFLLDPKTGDLLAVNNCRRARAKGAKLRAEGAIAAARASLDKGRTESKRHAGAD